MSTYKQPERVQTSQNPKICAGSKPSLDVEDTATNLAPSELLCDFTASKSVTNFIPVVLGLTDHGSLFLALALALFE
jgi:hypothetical protein